MKTEIADYEQQNELCRNGGLEIKTATNPLLKYH